MSSILGKLFDSPDRVKIIRLFLLNQEDVFTSRDIIVRAKISSQSARRETNLLLEIGFIRRKKKTKKPEDAKKRKIEGWALDFSFPLLLPLKKLVLDTSPLLARQEFLKKILRTGRIKLVVLAGIFLQKDSSRVDVLVVGDKIQKSSLERILKQAEAEIGKDLIYAVFNTEDFVYRLGICDKFVRDILDYPHVKLLNKLNL